MKYLGGWMLVLLFSVAAASGQGRKEIKKLQIRSITETTTDFAGEAERTHKTSEKKFDKSGRSVEVYDYKKGGMLDRRFTYSYDASGSLKEEIEYKPDGSLHEKIIYKYNAHGEKTGELHYNSTGKLIRRHEFVYDKNGLKSVRKTFDGEGKPVMVKKYTYGY